MWLARLLFAFFFRFFRVTAGVVLWLLGMCHTFKIIFLYAVFWLLRYSQGCSAVTNLRFRSYHRICLVCVWAVYFRGLAGLFAPGPACGLFSCLGRARPFLRFFVLVCMCFVHDIIFPCLPLALLSCELFVE